MHKSTFRRYRAHFQATAEITSPALHVRTAFLPQSLKRAKHEPLACRFPGQTRLNERIAHFDVIDARGPPLPSSDSQTRANTHTHTDTHCLVSLPPQTCEKHDTLSKIVGPEALFLLSLSLSLSLFLSLSLVLSFFSSLVTARRALPCKNKRI